MTEIYLDIETIPSQLPWVKDYIAEKTTPPGNIKKQETVDAWYAEKHQDAIEEALLKCSFDGAVNHIICISASAANGEPVSFYQKDIENEGLLLLDFYTWLQNSSSEFGRVFVGHNVSGFDLKVIRQRSIILGVKPPPGIPFDAKPWEKNPFDTMVQWDSKNMTSLDKIARALGIEAKSDVDGSMVYQMWKEGKHKEIADYCCDDVRMVREVYKKIKIIL